ncbi:MAG: hypothetical protein ACK5BG_02325, partial [Pseudanabaena sp.]
MKLNLRDRRSHYKISDRTTTDAIALKVQVCELLGNFINVTLRFKFEKITCYYPRHRLKIHI